MTDIAACRDLNARNLAYLSSEQALADLAYFIEAMIVKYEIPDGTKWIAFGGSYSGALAAWLRAKYPHLIHGAVSASAPLLAKADFRGMPFEIKFRARIVVFITRQALCTTKMAHKDM